MQKDFINIPTLAVVGPGLIGGSVAAALKKANAVKHVVGVGSDQADLNMAQSLGLIDTVASLPHAAAQADIILLATPVGAMPSLLKELKKHLHENCIVTDVGSTKKNIVHQAEKILQDSFNQFVPAHPIAGAEKTGPKAASSKLFDGKNVVLTPTNKTNKTAQEEVVKMWVACGARVLVMSPNEHDEILASVSHVPHFLSSVYMWQVASAFNSDLRLTLAGTGFQDFTRIAAGSAEVWRDIFLSNKEAVLNELKQVQKAFAHAEKTLIESDEKALYDFLEKAALARRLWASRSGYGE